MAVIALLSLSGKSMATAKGVRFIPDFATLSCYSSGNMGENTLMQVNPLRCARNAEERVARLENVA